MFVRPTLRLQRAGAALGMSVSSLPLPTVIWPLTGERQMIRSALIVSTLAVIALAVACGGRSASSTDRAPDDADAADAESEAGTLACGDAICSPAQICLYPAYGCFQLAPIDAGVCPGGTQYSDASGGCLPPVPTPWCVSPSPGDAFDCSGPDAGPDCDNAVVPLPASCSRICRGNCV
jgi:hypothetical protein